MSTTTPTPATIDRSLAPIPFGRELKVEFRKMIDTRGGLWLFIVTGLFLVAVMALTLLVNALNDEVRIGASGFMRVMTIPVSILMPVFAILTVTSEWSQRTNLTSFTIQPSRLRLLLAKFTAASLFAIFTIALAFGLGVIGNLLNGAITGHEVIWNVDAKNVIWAIGLQLCTFWMAFALATLLLNTPATVAVFYVVAIMLPFMVYSTLFSLFGWARNLIPWLDFSYAAAPLSTGKDFFGDVVDVGALEWFRFVFTIFLWIVLPLSVGILRLRRSEIK
jgi:ABC-2 type transport system permease protein